MSSSNGTAATTPPTSEQPTSTPVSLTSQSPSTNPPSSTQPSSSAAASSTSKAASTTSTSTASSKPPTTTVVTSVVTPTPTKSGETPVASTVVVTISNSATPDATTAPDATASASSAPGLQNPKSGKAQGGLSDAGKTAIAVVVPVVVVALLVIAGILLWRKRKQKKDAEEARRKEVEEYGFNPNHDPTLPAVGMQSEMAEDQSGYRGWGNTTSSSNRKASTTLTSGMTHSDSNSNPGGYQSPGSPTQAYSDGQSGDPLMNGRRETMDSDGIGALGAAPNASQNQGGVHRGPSNASSSYSAADRSDNSGDYPIPVNNPQEYYENNGYYQPGPYEQSGYGQQPIIRDVSARRNTRIENPSVFPQQGNSGIAQNF